MKRYCFTTDDNILFLRDMSVKEYSTVFEHPYLELFKKMHEKYGLCVQMNLFYSCEEFSLAHMSDRYRNEFLENADWLLFSFHSEQEYPAHPYRSASYEEVFRDSSTVNREISRFAGDRSLAPTTTLHYCTATAEGTRALYDCGVRGLFELFGDEKSPRDSYALSPDKAALVRAGIPTLHDGITYFNIDVILDRLNVTEIPAQIDELSHKDFMGVLIHEQYFYPEYRYYQSDYADKVELAVKCLNEKGFTSVLARDIL